MEDLEGRGGFGGRRGVGGSSSGSQRGSRHLGVGAQLQSRSDRVGVEGLHLDGAPRTGRSDRRTWCGSGGPTSCWSSSGANSRRPNGFCCRRPGEDMRARQGLCARHDVRRGTTDVGGRGARNVFGRPLGGGKGALGARTSRASCGGRGGDPGHAGGVAESVLFAAREFDGIMVGASSESLLQPHTVRHPARTDRPGSARDGDRAQEPRSGAGLRGQGRGWVTAGHGTADSAGPRDRGLDLHGRRHRNHGARLWTTVGWRSRDAASGGAGIRTRGQLVHAGAVARWWGAGAKVVSVFEGNGRGACRPSTGPSSCWTTTRERRGRCSTPASDRRSDGRGGGLGGSSAEQAGIPSLGGVRRGSAGRAPHRSNSGVRPISGSSDRVEGGSVGPPAGGFPGRRRSERGGQRGRGDRRRRRRRGGDHFPHSSVRRRGLAARHPCERRRQLHACAQEIGSEVVARARVVVEDRAAAMEEAGDLIVPVRQGVVGGTWSTPIWAKSSTAPPHEAPAGRDLTFFKSVGVAVQDVAIAAEALRRAQARGAGLVVAMSQSNVS